MKNKYYRPKIEEFYIGFEYQIEDKNNWFIRDYPIYPLNKESLSNFNIRVKYLDKEDIESLGWKYYKTHAGTTLMEFEKDNFELSYDPNFMGKQYLRIAMEGDGDVTMFIGNIKNKSELKKLLNQLNIS